MSVLNSILAEPAKTGITFGQFFLCTGTALVLGFLLTLVHRYKNTCSRNFTVTLALLPAIVQAVILMVNGNLGTGVAVMGAFSLVRFRSVPGNAREIGSIFLAMAIGLACGTGYLGIAAFLLLTIGLAELLFLSLPHRGNEFPQRELKVTIPENLDYSGIFDDIFDRYADETELIRVKTVNMGSLYELCYHLRMKREQDEKKMLDDIRCRNGNLTIVCGRIAERGECL